MTKLKWKTTQEGEEAEDIAVVTDVTKKEGKDLMQEMNERYPELEELTEEETGKGEIEYLILNKRTTNGKKKRTRKVQNY